MSDKPPRSVGLRDEPPPHRVVEAPRASDAPHRADGPGLGLFEGYGLELEYMIVAKDTLDVAPLCDRLLDAGGMGSASELERGPVRWSNELVLHVVELKTNGPARTLEGVAAQFAADVREANRLLEPLGARLMPTGMHPWMRPATETVLWPHEHREVYELFDRIFTCRGHGWANVQSLHVNLPFRGDDELVRLHTAVRLVLPLLPALAASSPIVDGSPTGLMDSRLEYYRTNCRAIPSVTGLVVPEPITSRRDYRARILEPILRDLARFDRRGALDPEWVNARGAIVRFVRDAIEIRVLDCQETPRADLAIAALVAEVVRALVDERYAGMEEQLAVEQAVLAALLLRAIADAEHAVVDDARLLACLGLPARKATLRELWHALRERHGPRASELSEPLDVILSEGPLARRIVRATARGERLCDVYARLADCLAEGAMFAA